MKQAFLALLLLSASAFGQAPSAVVKVDPPGPVKPGTFVKIDATESVGQLIDFDTDVADANFRADSNGKIIYFNAQASGVYPFKFEALSVIDGVVRKSKSKVSIAVEGAAPVPPPSPPPNPGPDDTPAPGPIVNPIVSGPLQVTLFYDVNDPSVVQFKESKALAAELAKLDCSWYMAATNSPVAQLFLSELSADKTPIALIQKRADWAYVKDAAGKNVTIKAPRSAADIVATVKALRGGAR